MKLTTEQRIKRSHVQLMKHPETALYSGVFMMGESEVVDSNITAYTDGVNKKYGRKFVDPLPDIEINGLVLHENLHIVFRHLLHNRDLFKKNRVLANMAADYVVNDVIASLKDQSLAKLPEGGLLDPRFHNMNMREVYRILEKEEEEEKKKRGKPCEGQKGEGGKPGGPGEPGDKQDQDGQGGYKFDEHDFESTESQTPEEIKAHDERVDRALREGALLAGRMGAKIPRAINELLTPKTRWQDELREFVASTTKGKDEYTWRRFNRRLLPNDIYMPSVENETIGEVVIAIDTSGSIGSEQLNEFAAEMVSLCEAVSPERLRVLWWDTMVHGEQIFEGDYTGLAHMLKPMGGGGTRVGCVPEYINKQNIRPECVIVFTDGHVESDPRWDIKAPTLWLVTRNKRWMPPVGRKVVFEQ